MASDWARRKAKEVYDIIFLLDVNYKRDFPMIVKALLQAYERGRKDERDIKNVKK